MPPESLEQKAEGCVVIIRRLNANLQQALGLEAMLRRANDDQILQKKFANTYEGHGMSLVQHTLMLQLIMSVMRMHDRGATDRASLARLFELLNDKAVVRTFVDRARKWTPDSQRWASQHAHFVAKKTYKAKIRYERLAADADGGKKWMETLRRYRDHHVAHSLVLVDAGEPARYGT
jgi:hypothetical protein